MSKPTLEERYPNIAALAKGCVSGSFSEWPQLAVEARIVLDRLDAIAELVRSIQEVIRISDRKHDAWDATKAALDKLNGGKS